MQRSPELIFLIQDFETLIFAAHTQLSQTREDNNNNNNNNNARESSTG